jgi:hypothetical protein
LTFYCQQNKNKEKAAMSETEVQEDSPLQNPYENLPSNTHAERHPDLPRQDIRVLTKNTLTEAQKATRALRLIADKEKNALLITDLEVLLLTQHKELEDLANKHAVKIEYVQNLITHSSHFKKKRGVTLQNALLHHKAVEVNAGMSLILYEGTGLFIISLDLCLGEKKKMAEIRELMKEDSSYDNLTKEQEEDMKNELLSFRDEKKKGARTTNKSSAQDYRSVCGNLNDEVSKQSPSMFNLLTAIQISALSQCTGAVVVAFFSRSHIEDTFEPNWIASENATNFTQDALGHGMWDVARLLEQWACSKAKGTLIRHIYKTITNLLSPPSP